MTAHRATNPGPIAASPLPWDTGEPPARPITVKVRDIATVVFNRIVTHVYPFGTRLPSERDLAVDFDVSRNTVRQALDLLEIYNIIERRSGSGSSVKFRADPVQQTVPVGQTPDTGLLDLDEISENASPLELNVVRTILEPEIARLAVINMSAREIRALRDIQEQMDTVTTSYEEFSRLDEAFHLQMAKGTHNPILIGIYTLLNHVRQHAQWAKSKHKTLTPQRIRDYKHKHRSICDAIEARDIESTVEFVKLHMTDVHEDLIGG